MADKPNSGRGGQTSGNVTRGYQPAATPGKVQGGYQAPSGGGKPATPSTGSGVSTTPSAPAGGKK